MKQSILVTACILFAAAGALAAEKKEKVEILDSHQATVANDKKPELKAAFIADEKAWKEVWEKIGGEAKLPAVDFAKEFLLISTQDAADPNRRRASVMKDEKGVVSLLEISTKIGFQPSDKTKCVFHKISREGVTGVKRYDAGKKEWVTDELPK